ncbi:MAG: NYN domain-containing protein [Candidatus Aminicenantaceae bacterium]
MAYLIDGNNLLGYLFPENIRDPENKYSLISKLSIFQKLTKTRVILVFDGPPDLNIKDKYFRIKKFSIIYPPFQEKADEIIKEIILKQTDLRRFFVVSSDREIRNFAQKNRAKTLKCDEFHKQLKKALKDYKKLKEKEKNVEFPSSFEIEQWLKIFKKK